MAPYTPAMVQHQLPAGVTVFERGWLSSNNILMVGRDHCALVDSGYATHATQTLALVGAALGGRALDRLLNTHLHSDHCGGNATLQTRYPGLQTLIPPGHAHLVAPWNPQALGYLPTGQVCPAFHFESVLQPGSEIVLGDCPWQIHAAPGHDPNSVILFEPQSRLLLSADALWGNGFGVVFPELDGADAFEAVADTLDLIESLAPRTVIPGHGALFSDVAKALERARRRLDSYVADPLRHRRYATKVLIKFKLLEAQQLSEAALLNWARNTELLVHLHRDDQAGGDFGDWMAGLIDELASSGALRRVEAQILNQ